MQVVFITQIKDLKEFSQGIDIKLFGKEEWIMV